MKKRIVQLRSEGLGATRISQRLGIKRSTVVYHLREDIEKSVAKLLTRRWREKNIDHVYDYGRRYREEHRDQIHIYNKNYAVENKTQIDTRQKNNRYRLRKTVIEMYGPNCVCCGEDEPMFLDLDHVNNDGILDRKRIGNSSTAIYREATKCYDPTKYQILCANCNVGRARNHNVCPHTMIVPLDEWTRTYTKPSDRKQNAELRAAVIRLYGGQCNCCGETIPHFLELDHINGGGTAELKRLGWKRMYRNALQHYMPNKYQILCVNCNRGKERNCGICPHQEPTKNRNPARRNEPGSGRGLPDNWSRTRMRLFSVSDEIGPCQEKSGHV